ncbi:hypothetical protein Maq22A_c02570 [Methylobacterium aquaticum]|uniref:Uncharacterized protein n=1 Tax=Methylobacterium aquaticum TaxID=270351 RepID=A0A0C6FAZ3_9HYPH|nr:hypothetical protein Maq22A_c02570 [Methylobacterium aquaticum]
MGSGGGEPAPHRARALTRRAFYGKTPWSAAIRPGLRAAGRFCFYPSPGRSPCDPGPNPEPLRQPDRSPWETRPSLYDMIGPR